MTKFMLVFVGILLTLGFVATFPVFSFLCVIGIVVYVVINKRNPSGKYDIIKKIKDRYEAEQLGVVKQVDIEEPKKPTAKITRYNVKGVFAHEDDIFHNLMERNPEYDYTKADLIEFCGHGFPIYKWIPKPLSAELIPEPDNKYDPNAIRVDVGGITIGYVPKEKCAEVLEIMSSGRVDNISYEISGGAFKQLEEDYDPNKDRSTYSLETGKAELFANLYIREIVEE